MSEYVAGADYINWTTARGSRPEVAAVKRMIGEKTTFWLIAAGWLTAGLSGLLTAFLAYRNAANLNPANFIDAAILLALAYGIFRKSRICATLALLYYVASQVLLVRMLHGAMTLGGLLQAALFTTLCLMGIVGTFAWRRGNQRTTDAI